MGCCSHWTHGDGKKVWDSWGNEAQHISISLVVHWLRFPLPMQRVRVRPLVGELSFYMPHGQKTKIKKKRRSNILTNSIKTLRMVFIHQVMSNSSGPHGLQHTRLPCPSPSPGVYPSSCPLNQWCHPTISSSFALFSFCLQYFPASGSFPMSQLFASDGQSKGACTTA